MEPIAGSSAATCRCAMRTEISSSGTERFTTSKTASAPRERCGKVKLTSLTRNTSPRLAVGPIDLLTSSDRKWYGTLHDIEDRKRAEGEVRKSETYLAHAQHLTKVGSWAYRPPDIFRSEVVRNASRHRRPQARRGRGAEK